MRRWSEGEYEVLFRDHPPIEPQAPSRAECDVLAKELNRKWGAVRSQWDDGRSLVLGHRNDASLSLRDYVVRRGWLQS